MESGDSIREPSLSRVRRRGEKLLEDGERVRACRVLGSSSHDGELERAALAKDASSPCESQLVGEGLACHRNDGLRGGKALGRSVRGLDQLRLLGDSLADLAAVGGEVAATSRERMGLERRDRPVQRPIRRSRMGKDGRQRRLRMCLRGGSEQRRRETQHGEPMQLATHEGPPQSESRQPTSFGRLSPASRAKTKPLQPPFCEPP